MNVALAQTTNFKGYIPPSPNAMTFQRYGDYPVDYSTGVPSINIPIYTIGVKGFSYPVSANFHASGRTASLNYSPLGLNWALIGSGVVSREVRGAPDETSPYNEQPVSYYNSQADKFDELNKLTSNYYDPLHDIFSVNVNGVSAKFIIRSSTITFLTNCPYKIQVLSNGQAYSGFILTDDHGIVYNFGQDASGYGYTESNSSQNFPSSWFLNTVTLPTGQQLKFKYGNKWTAVSDDAFYGNFSYSDNATIADKASAPSFKTNPGDYQTASTLHRNNVNLLDDYYMGYLTEIDFDEGKMFFTYDASTLQLTEAKVIRNSDNLVVRDAVFNYYATIPGSTVTLLNNCSKTIQSIVFKDAAGAEAERYSFEYYSGTGPTSLYDLGTAKDYWGYYNGRTGGTNGSRIPIPSITIEPGGTNPTSSYEQTLGCNGCRDAVFDTKLSGMLRKIYFPTGGSSEFFYEPNYYKENTGSHIVKEGPGIRIKQIQLDDGIGKQTVKSYKYGVDEDGNGYLSWQPSPSLDNVTSTIRDYLDWSLHNPPNFPYDYGFYRWRTFSSEPQAEMQRAYHTPVYYNQVTEYVSGQDTKVTNGKTVYNYSIPGNSVSYTSLPGDGFFPVFRTDDWRTPQLTSKVVYKGTAKENYVPVNGTIYNYNDYNTFSIPQVLVIKGHEFPSDNTGKSIEYITKTPPANPIGYPYSWQVFYVIDKTITGGVSKLQSEITTQYDDNGNQQTATTTYSYNNALHMYPTAITTKKSDGAVITAYSTFPQDYAAGTAFIDDLKATNNVAVPVEKISAQVKAGATQVLSGQLMTYKTGGKGLQDKVYSLETRAPVDISSFKFSNTNAGSIPFSTGFGAFVNDGRYKQKISYDIYDASNNPVQVTTSAAGPISYKWGYQGYYPVLEAKGALSRNLFYNGFEESGANTAAGDCKSGLYSHTGAYSVTISPDNGNYILAYWQKSGSAWIYMASPVTVTNGSYTISLNAQVDDIRFFPAAAQVTTHNYSPMIGLTSSSDPSGKFGYFDYDDAGRLKTIKDNDKNVLKTISYKFSNPTFFSDERTVSVTKNDCDPSLYFGETINYTIAHGAFSSTISVADANTKRDNYIAATSQAYANANGTCKNYKNSEISKTFTTQCSAGLYGNDVVYTVPYGKWTSTVSYDDAQAKATQDLNNNGQAYANAHGNCLTYAQLFKNDYTFSGIISKSNCPTGYKSNTNVSFTVTAGQFTSANSVAEANSKAQQAVAAKQQEVDNTGSCVQLAQVSVYLSNSSYVDQQVSLTNTTQGYQTVSVTLKASSSQYVTIGEGVYSISASSPNSNTYHYSLTVPPAAAVQKAGSSASFSGVNITGTTSGTTLNITN
ncbi:DUF5977 domain-containing protein [Deminuibacter soli]|uniref:DUF5977 domain-containing protein n=1 Tax=Deminuibacter soli TaxID=2291815 RepID=UPI001314B28F|nr:DUF5977 domain-containing protein [Deminuibacter soli]